MFRFVLLLCFYLTAAQYYDDPYTDAELSIGSSEENIETNIRNGRIEERIENDLEKIYGSWGTEVQFNYNETSSTASVPGCPKSIEGIPWIYYGDNPPRCFLAGQTGPCPFRQKLLAVKNSPFGLCACECVVDGIRDGTVEWNTVSYDGFPERYINCKKDFSRTSKWGQVYDKQRNKCYEMGTQGPCETGYILDDSTGSSLVCLKSCSSSPGQIAVQDTDGSCRQYFELRVAGASILPGECLDNEQYSNILKKCIKKRKFFFA